MNLDSKWRLNLWQLLFLVLSTSWMLAPFLNHVLSSRTALISQYELPAAPYSTFFRFFDMTAALLLISVAVFYRRRPAKKSAALLLGLVGLGMFADPIFSTTCHMTNGVCVEYVSWPFFLHALETIVTAFGLFALALYDTVLRKRLVSIVFVIFQVLYGLLFVSQLASHAKYNTFSQFVYQLTIVIWLTWYVRDYIVALPSSDNLDQMPLIKQLAAAWAFLNGTASILISLADIHVIGRLKGLYFAGDSAWLAQHGMVVGVVMIYLSRHLLRGERRARHIFMAISLLETLKYSVITPNPGLLAVYFGTFCALFILKDAFDRGVASMTMRLRLKEVLFLGISLVVVAAVSLLILYSNTHSMDITNRSLDHFLDYTLRTKFTPDSHLESALLAHAFSAFLLSSVLLILWVLFKPSKPLSQNSQEARNRAESLLKQFSNSTEDFFKVWPDDKQYFWQGDAFITYKIAGPVAFALADPIAGNQNARDNCLQAFVKFCRSRSLRVCFLPIYKESEKAYSKLGLNVMQIGSSALIDTDVFVNTTIKDKWWRWQRNRATKSGYEYAVSSFPHPEKFLSELKNVSDSWLSKEGRQERRFAMGYFDKNYLNQCDIHFLKDGAGRIVAFTNQLPAFTTMSTASIDLIRYRQDADNAMPFLLSSAIERLHNDGYKWFDLGFVPFAETNDPAIKFIRAISSGRFSAKGLEQFKNKFDPVWQPNYLGYDGDYADLALITINVERVMSPD